jgi:hypothetical protein
MESPLGLLVSAGGLNLPFVFSSCWVRSRIAHEICGQDHRVAIISSYLFVPGRMLH